MIIANQVGIADQGFDSAYNALLISKFDIATAVFLSLSFNSLL